MECARREGGRGAGRGGGPPGHRGVSWVRFRRKAYTHTGSKRSRDSTRQTRASYTLQYYSSTAAYYLRPVENYQLRASARK